MKAQTTLQLQIVELSKKLKPISIAHKNWAIKSCIDHISPKNANNMLTCLNCANSYLDALSKHKNTICPNCNIKSNKLITKKKIFNDEALFVILDQINNIQVIRYFQISAKFRKNEKAVYLFNELFELWITANGKVEIFGRIQMCSYYGIKWLDTFEIRNKKNLDKYNLQPYKIYPKKSLIHEFKRVNLVSEIIMTPLDTFKRLLIPKFETLYKAKQIELFNIKQNISIVDTYWKSIKICLRNNYIIENPTIWFDYLSLLKEFNKDLLNSKYVCPTNLETAHNRLVQKKNEILNRKSIEERKELIEEEQIAYFQEKSKYFNLFLTNNNINIVPIKHVKDFLIIGNNHNHCIFTNSYYKKSESLLLTAVNNENIVLETIELSISDCNIIQSYGPSNKITPFHNAIKNLINSNKNYLKQILSA